MDNFYDLEQDRLFQRLGEDYKKGNASNGRIRFLVSEGCINDNLRLDGRFEMRLKDN